MRSVIMVTTRKGHFGNLSTHPNLSFVNPIHEPGSLKERMKKERPKLVIFDGDVGKNPLVDEYDTAETAIGDYDMDTWLAVYECPIFPMGCGFIKDYQELQKRILEIFETTK